jgi:NDP-sugar pyrophosphorylase family protein
MILHQIESLAAAGVTDIVLAVNYRPDVMVTALKKVRCRRVSSTACFILTAQYSMDNNTMSISNSLWSRNLSAPPGL